MADRRKSIKNTGKSKKKSENHEINETEYTFIENLRKPTVINGNPYEISMDFNRFPLIFIRTYFMSIDLHRFSVSFM